MKKHLFAFVLVVALIGCNDGTNNNAAAETKTNAAANDSTQAPNGITTGSSISTNTDATKTDSAQRQ